MNRRKVHDFLSTRLNLDVRVVRAGTSGPNVRHAVVFEADSDYHARYRAGLVKSGTPPHSRRPERFYNLLRFLDMTDGTPGFVGECGTWRGLSAYLLSHRLRDADAEFRGAGVHLFDSFAGLSEPGPGDDIDDPGVREASERAAVLHDRYAAGTDVVRSTLDEFPDVSLHPGWIPSCFASAPDGQWRFVHVDVDLHDPTREALEFFWPRLARGGAIVCDDYGALQYPGAKQAVDDFCATRKARYVSLSTGQAMIFPPDVI